MKFVASVAKPFSFAFARRPVGQNAAAAASHAPSDNSNVVIPSFPHSPSLVSTKTRKVPSFLSVARTRSRTSNTASSKTNSIWSSPLFPRPKFAEDVVGGNGAAVGGGSPSSGGRGLTQEQRNEEEKIKFRKAVSKLRRKRMHKLSLRFRRHLRRPMKSIFRVMDKKRKQKEYMRYHVLPHIAAAADAMQLSLAYKQQDDIVAVVCAYHGKL